MVSKKNKSLKCFSDFFASGAKVSDKRSYFLNTFQVGMGRKHQNGNLFAARAVKRSFRLKRNGNDSCSCIFTALKNDPPLASDAAKFLTEKNFTTEFPFLGQFTKYFESVPTSASKIVPQSSEKQEIVFTDL